MSTYEDDSDYLEERIRDLENEIVQLENTCSSLESERDELQKKLEAEGSEMGDRILALCDEVYQYRSDGFNTFYELVAVPMIEDMHVVGTPPLETFENIVDSSRFSDLAHEALHTKLNVFRNNEDETHINGSYTILCDFMDRLMNDIFHNTKDYDEFILGLCKNVYLCPTNILAVLNEYTTRRIDHVWINDLPTKIKKSLGNSLVVNFYNSSSYVPQQLLGSLNSYSRGAPHVTSLKELYIILWDYLHEGKHSKAVKENDMVGRQIDCVIRHKRGSRNVGGLITLGEHCVDKGIVIPEDLYITYMRQNYDGLISYVKYVMSNNKGIDIIKSMPNEVRKEINILKLKGDFK